MDWDRSGNLATAAPSSRSSSFSPAARTSCRESFSTPTTVCIPWLRRHRLGASHRQREQCDAIRLAPRQSPDVDFMSGAQIGFSTISYNVLSIPSYPTTYELFQAAHDDITNQNRQATGGIGGSRDREPNGQSDRAPTRTPSRRSSAGVHAGRAAGRDTDHPAGQRGDLALDHLGDQPSPGERGGPGPSGSPGRRPRLGHQQQRDRRHPAAARSDDQRAQFLQGSSISPCRWP